MGALEQAVEKAGFELAGLSVEVSGELLEEGNARLVARPGMTFLLLENRGGTPGPPSAETLRRIRESNALGDGSVRLAGTVGGRGEAELTLVLGGIEAAE